MDKKLYKSFRFASHSIRTFLMVGGVFFLTSITTLNAQPPNDLCGNAIDIGCDETISGTTTMATTGDAPAFCETGLSSAGGVWYHFVGTGDLVKVTTCAPGGISYDTKVGVFSGSCGALTCVAGNDDQEEETNPDCELGGSNLASTVFFASTNMDYYIYVTGFNTSTGDFDLTLSCFEPPANDSPCTPTYLPFGGTLIVDNIGATVDIGEPSPGAGTVGPSPTCNAIDGWCSFETGVQNSVWYRFFSPVPCVNITMTGDDLQLAVWATDDCGDFSQYVKIGANDDGGPGLAPALDFEVTPYIQYYVQVDGFGGETTNNSTITVQESNTCPEPCTNFGLTLTINLDNFPTETTWELRRDDGTLAQAGGPYSSPSGTVVEQLCSDADCYDFTIFDSFGDGICCGFGIGSYTLTDAEGNIIVDSDGIFGASETTSFCTTCESPLPAPWDNSDIGSANGDAYYDQCEGAIVVESSNYSTPLTDVQHTAYQQLCGNSSITAKVSDFIGQGGWVGIQMRESLSTGSKKVALKTQLGNFVRRDYRSTTGGMAVTQQTPVPVIGGDMWLRITRTDYGFGAPNYFIFETSVDGVSWASVGTIPLVMSNCLYVGLFSEDTNVNSTTTGFFTNVSVTGMPPAPLAAPDGPVIQTLSNSETFNDFTIYPNPATDELNIKLGNLDDQRVNLIVRNALGQEMMNQQLEAVGNMVERMDISKLSSGIYYLSLYTSDGSEMQTKKFVVKSNRP